MQFLNPKTDFAFKKIFGSAQSGQILISFLNALLELEGDYRIEHVDILDPYLAPKIKGMKDTYLDVKVKDRQGKHYIVEMQVLNVEGFEQRILYNACKAYAGQIAKGEDYRLLTDVVALTITDFVMFKEQSSWSNKFKLRAQDGRVYSDDLELVFIELPKFNGEEHTLSTTSERWLYFLKHAADLRAVPTNLSHEVAICQAFAIANKAGLNPEELDDQERREMFIQDQRGVRTKALMEGRAEGKAEGMQLALNRLMASGMDETQAKTLLGLD